VRTVLAPGAPQHRHSAADITLLGAEILTAYLRVRWLLRRHDLPTVVSSIGAPTRRSPESAAGPAELRVGARLARSTSRCLAALPADSRCLVRSLVLIAVLARRGIASSLVIGVRPGGEFAAHAWVELDGLPLLPADGEDYERLLELHSRGSGPAV
jgi:hypothetical protein